MTISSHGEIVKTDDQGGSESFEIFEDNILTHQDSSAFSRDDSRVPVREIIEVFRDRKLKQIPKIFFIQVTVKQYTLRSTYFNKSPKN